MTEEVKPKRGRKPKIKPIESVTNISDTPEITKSIEQSNHDSQVFYVDGIPDDKIDDIIDNFKETVESKKTIKSTAKDLWNTISTKQYRIMVYKQTFNSRRVYMPQERSLGIWSNMIDDEHYATYAEHTAIDVVNRKKDIETDQFNKKIQPIKYIDL